MVRNKDGIGSNRRNDFSLKDNFPSSTRNLHPIFVLEAIGLGQRWMNLYVGFWAKVDQATDTTSLRSTQILRYHSPGGEDYGIFVIRFFEGRPVSDGIEMRFLVGSLELKVLPQPGRSWMTF